MQRQIAARISEIRTAVPCGAIRIAALFGLAAVATLVALAGAGPGVSHAATDPGGSGPFETAHQGQADAELIWSADMTVGRASDSILAYTGYLPDLNPPEGHLDNREFRYNDVDYTILGIFQQEFGESVKQLVFNADQPLPDDLIFKAGDMRFPLHKAADLGSRRNIHAWTLETALDWSEGQTIPLSLFRLVESLTPPNSPDDIRIDQAMVSVYGMTGEIEESGQFQTISVTLETGKRYVVEMKGAATGDGTLSDPWISGINGRYRVDGQYRWEPAWYDAAGRTSTSVEFPGGVQYEVDENGRMFSASTDRHGATVLRPVTGGNDDGGEGFNARLFLINFPGGEYQVVVSGAPNPNDTGTYTFSLMEIVSDDYSASPDQSGALTVGGSAVANIESPGDVDWFRVDLEASVDYTIQIQGQFSGAGTLPDPRFAGIYDGQGALLDGTSNDHQAPRTLSDSLMTFTPANTGAYYVAVSGYHIYLPHLSTPPVGTYTVSVAAQE